MMKMRNWMVVLLIVLVCPLAAKAELERTNWAWDTRLPDKGKFVANVWLGYETYDYSSVDVDGEYTNSTLHLSYGLCDNWSLGFQAGYSTSQVKGMGYDVSQDDASDIKVVTTYRILDEAVSGLDVALRGELNIPTAARDRFGTGHWEPRLEVLMAKNFGPVIAVTNVGVRHIVDADDGLEDFTVDAVFECVLPLGEKFSVSGFVNGGTMRWETSADALYYSAGAGLRYFPTESIYLSGSANRYLFREAITDDWYFTLGMGVEF